MNRKTRAILSVAVLLSLGTAAPVWAAEAPPAPQVQQQEPDFVTTADQAIRDVRTVGFVDTDGSKLKAIVLSYDRPIPAAAVDASTFAIEDYGMTLREQDLTQGTLPGALKRVYVNDVPDTIASPSGWTIWRRCDFLCQIALACGMRLRNCWTASDR